MTQTTVALGPGLTQHLSQAGHNFPNVHISYVKKLCGTFLGGPKLPLK